MPARKVAGEPRLMRQRSAASKPRARVVTIHKALEGPISIGIVAVDGGRQLGDTVADAIVNAVAQGTLQPGERIVESDLARKLKVSRVPIREAIKILQAQGILYVTPNRGARVAPFEPNVVDQVFEVRVALERIAVRDAVQAYRRDPRQIDALREIVSRMERVARRSDWVEFRKRDVDFHHEICRVSRNEIVLKLWEALARHITIIFGRELASERNFELLIDQHRKLIWLFESLDPRIEQVIEDHIMRLRRQAGRAQPASVRRMRNEKR